MHWKNKCFIISLIRLQRVYNFLLFHAVTLAFLDILQSFYSNFISFFGTNLLTKCPVPVAVFLLVFYFTEYQYQTDSKRNKTFWRILWTRRHNMGQRSTRGEARGGHNPPGRAQEPKRAHGGCAPHEDLPDRLLAL